jgi:predicted P-loop ATPase
MSYDAQLYYNPEAQQLPVIRESGDVLKAYKGTQVEDGGEVVWYPEYNERERLQMEYQACLSKAIDEEADDSERCVQLLADYCAKARLGEEGCVKRTQGRFRFRDVSDDLIRKIFRNAYKQPYEGRALSQMNEKERIMRSIENFLNRRYQLRFNVVKQVTEFRKNDLLFKPWEPLTDRELKSIAVEEMKEGGESWMRDIQTYIESAHITDYNPVHEFLAGCGEWDGKRDYIEEFAHRLPTDYEDWPKYFHRWFLAMVAQALDMNRDHGNSMVPMLIGGQGIMKSTFCKNILPPSMREYYMDDIKMDNAEQVERVLGRMWLVCIDEYNAKTDREQAKIKRILTEKDVQVRKMRSDQYTMTPRLCSFIATTNDPTPLPSGDGSRRYLCVEVTGPVNMKGRIPYKQMFAQAVRELHQSNCLYWFTSDDEARIQRHNSRYQQESSLETILQNLFSPTNQHRKENFWQVSDIQQELSKHLKSKDLPNLSTLGMSIKHLQWKRRVVKGLRGYYLQRKGV